MDMFGIPPREYVPAIFVILLGFIVFGITLALYDNTTRPPSNPTLLNGLMNRARTISDYLTTKSKTVDNTLMRDLNIATAAFGGVFTENRGVLSPYNGTVDPDAVNLQVRSGARAVIFDIWPDPADPTVPVVATMIDEASNGSPHVFGTPSWWVTNGGLSKGTGRYSNWKTLSRNRVRAREMLKTAVDVAFGDNGQPTNVQGTDPFFLILCLHGAMTTDYLNTLAADLDFALGHRAMDSSIRPQVGTANPLCSSFVRDFQSKACVIVCPDIQPGFQSLPSVNTYTQFFTAYSQTNMINHTNIMELQPNTILFSPSSIGAMIQDTTAPCDVSAAPGSLVPPPRAGFCVIAPSTGAPSTQNADLINDSAFSDAMNAGVQFIGINMFSEDDTFRKFFDFDNFGTYSFRLSR
jgi:hypothetical protein